jgi:hypothetical protein
MTKQPTARRAFWLAHIGKWQAGGGTLKAYALANDLPVGTFYAAKSAYARELANSSTNTPGNRATFLPVQLRPNVSREPIRICLVNGVRIEVPMSSALNTDDWRALLGALSAQA